MLLLVTLVAHLCSMAQTSQIDSLRKLLAQENRDTARISLLNQLSYQFENSKPDSSLALSEMALGLAKKKSHVAGEIASLNMIGLAFMTSGNYPKALEYLLESLKKSESIQDQALRGITLVNIGVVYSMEADYRQGINYQLQALPVNRELKREHNAALILLDLGTIMKNWISWIQRSIIPPSVLTWHRKSRPGTCWELR
jgi:tetratricopeptide (TPR) repeat protein